MGEATVKDAIVGMISKLGENMQIAQVQHVAGDSAAGYNHGGKVAAVVAGSGSADALRNVAMHVAAASPEPISLDRDGVPADLVEKERAIIAESDEIKNKPEQIQPKIIEGKLGRFYKENVLLEQEMLVANEDGGSVEKWAKANDISVGGYVRLSV